MEQKARRSDTIRDDATRDLSSDAAAALARGDRAGGHHGHRIIVRTPDMAGRPVVICTTCNARLADR